MGNLEKNPENAIRNKDYIKSAEAFFDERQRTNKTNRFREHRAKRWLTGDIGVVTVKDGFFKTKRDMRKSIFYLNKHELRPDRVTYFWGAGYGRVKPELG